MGTSRAGDFLQPRGVGRDHGRLTTRGEATHPSAEPQEKRRHAGGGEAKVGRPVGAALYRAGALQHRAHLLRRPDGVHRDQGLHPKGLRRVDLQRRRHVQAEARDRLRIERFEALGGLDHGGLPTLVVRCLRPPSSRQRPRGADFAEVGVM